MYAPSSDARRTTPAFVLALALLGALTFGGFQAWRQGRMAPGTVVSAEAFAAFTGFTSASGARGNDLHAKKSPAPTPGPGWEELNTAQKTALQPLAPRWAFLSELQKRHWLALAKNFPALPAAEQERLHARMTEWASLSAQQRSQARLNYGVTSRLSADSKRAQWEAYQTLSAEEKSRLAAAATRQPMGAATAVRPVAARKLAKVPAATAGANNPANPPKILATGEARPLSATEAKSATAVETAPIRAPVAVPTPLPPLPPATETAPPLSPEAAAQYTH